MSGGTTAVLLLLKVLEGSKFATAIRNNGKHCRIELPECHDSRRRLVESHIHGMPETLTFCARDQDPWRERVHVVVLAAYCPRSDGTVGWIAFDLDGGDHGASGLGSPAHGARAIAERADHLGLAEGLVVARSRRAHGRHIFLVLSEAVPLADAVIGTAALAAHAFRAAESDQNDCDAEHAFQRVDGGIAGPGDPGAVELIPRSKCQPDFGWAITLPCAGAYAAHGGGVIVEPFDNRPTPCREDIRCDHEAWSRLVSEARSALAKRRPSVSSPQHRHSARSMAVQSSSEAIDDRTRQFLDGRATEGTRNTAAFAASANLLGCGVPRDEAERLILAGSISCGLPEREARAAFASAERTVSRKRGQC